MLVVSKNSLFSARFHNSRNHPEWKDSDIREYLSGDFFNKAFSNTEKKEILKVFLSDVDSKDDVFLLSCDESNNYINSNTRISISSQKWWLRTKRDIYYLWGVDTDGTIPIDHNQ